ncbi:DUF6318 family protein [Arthrobacter mobilis]|uniref:DUF3597 domain-containing protein n=1 Tax=Arthrobacter mobilis TaxID=2724944 RepID=A0A7X6K370_9MICC|nr:DUF6318 family protein [Arthrobacter mobilis]NKX53185.1 DUF3597 domain-containing protein [Arthrobacter mobilis]
MSQQPNQYMGVQVSRVTVLLTRARMSAAVAAACALGLAACSGDAEGTGAGTPAPSVAVSSPAAAETTAPSATAAYKPASAEGPAENVPVPKIPEAAKEKSKKGLKAFVKYWYETLSFAYETGDFGPMKEVSGPGCAGCGRVEETISERHADGKWLVGGKLVVVGSVIEQFHPAPDGTYQVLTQVDQEPIFFYLPDGTLKQQTKHDIGIVDVINAEFADGRWTAKNVEGMG